MEEYIREAIKRLSVDERLELVCEIWDDIAEEGNELPLSAEQMAELDRRIDEMERHPNRGLTLEEFRQYLQERRSR
jgi:putative addiction module component (TIGR02574 family)